MIWYDFWGALHFLNQRTRPWGVWRWPWGLIWQLQKIWVPAPWGVFLFSLIWIVRPFFLWLRICQSAGTCRYVQKRCRAGGFVNGKLGPIVAYNEVVLEYPMGVSSHWMSMIIQYFLCYGVTFECPEWYESKKTSTIISLSLFWLEQWTKRLDSESAILRQHSLFSLARTQACNHRYDNRKTPRHSRPTA